MRGCPTSPIPIEMPPNCRCSRTQLGLLNTTGYTLKQRFEADLRQNLVENLDVLLSQSYACSTPGYLRLGDLGARSDLRLYPICAIETRPTARSPCPRGFLVPPPPRSLSILYVRASNSRTLTLLYTSTIQRCTDVDICPMPLLEVVAATYSITTSSQFKLVVIPAPSVVLRVCVGMRPSPCLPRTVTPGRAASAFDSPPETSTRTEHHAYESRAHQRIHSNAHVNLASQTASHVHPPRLHVRVRHQREYHMSHQYTYLHTYYSHRRRITSYDTSTATATCATCSVETHMGMPGVRDRGRDCAAFRAQQERRAVLTVGSESIGTGCGDAA